MHRITPTLVFSQRGCQVHEEESLVRRAQQQDQEALSEIFEIYFDRLYSYMASRIGNRAEAEDMTQQVFLKVLQSLPRYRWRGMPFSAWLFRIARNLVIDYHRGQGRARTVPLETALCRDSDDPVQIAEQRLTLEEVNQALSQLSESQQDVIRLRFAGELSVAEVAGIMGKSEGAIKALQHSAMVALRRVLLVGERE
jgi:RNA polymerase sigma-70 factor (ECF subfamily)